MKKVTLVLRFMFTGGALISGIDTFLVLACGVYVSTASMFEGWEYAKHAAVAVAVLFGGFTAVALDGGLHHILLDTLKGYATGHHKAHSKLYGYLLTVALLLGGGTVVVSVFCRHFVAATLVGESSLIDVTDARNRHQEAVNAEVAGIDKTIEELRRQKANARANAGTAGQRAVAAKAQKAGVESWAIPVVRDAQAAAVAPFDAKITAAIEQRAQAQQAATAQLSVITAGITAQNQSALSLNELRRNTVAGLTLMLAIGGTALMFISAIGLALLFSAYKIGQNPFKGITTATETKQEQPVKRNTKPTPQRTTSTGGATDNAPESRYNAVTDATEGQQRQSVADGEHGKVKLDNGTYYVYLYTPDGKAKWYSEDSVKGNLRTYKSQYKSPNGRNTDNIKRQMDTMAAGVAAINATKS